MSTARACARGHVRDDAAHCAGLETRAPTGHGPLGSCSPAAVSTSTRRSGRSRGRRAALQWSALGQAWRCSRTSREPNRDMVLPTAGRRPRRPPPAGAPARRDIWPLQVFSRLRSTRSQCARVGPSPRAASRNGPYSARPRYQSAPLQAPRTPAGHNVRPITRVRRTRPLGGGAVPCRCESVACKEEGLVIAAPRTDVCIDTSIEGPLRRDTRCDCERRRGAATPRDAPAERVDPVGPLPSNASTFRRKGQGVPRSRGPANVAAPGRARAP